MIYKLILIFILILIPSNALAYSIRLSRSQDWVKWREEKVFVCVTQENFILDDVKNSYQTWTQHSQNLPYVEFSYCEQIDQIQNEGTNVVVFTDHLPDDTLALTKAYYAKEGTIVGCDILINRNSNWNQYDLINILSHEFGHFLGFLDEENEIDSTMYPFIAPYEHQKEDLTSNDIQGLNILYSGNGCNICYNNNDWALILFIIIFLRFKIHSRN